MRITLISFFLFAAILFSPGYYTWAQEGDKSGSDSDELLQLLDDAPKKKREVTATFKTTRVVTGHSIENTGKGVLDFRINHRFGAIQGGLTTFFGLDNANTRIGFDYGVTDWLSIGIGRNTFQKEYDGFVKVRILRQTEENEMPISLSYVGGSSIQALPSPYPDSVDYPFSNRMYFFNQLLIARKFNQWLSLQIMPTHIHYNFVPTTPESNDMFAIGVGGRVKVSNRISVNGEYYYRVPGTEQIGYHNVFSLGVDIETGGHVFQLMLSNSMAMTERAYIGQTPGEWRFDNSGMIHFGFNISRVFTIVKPKEFEGSRNKIW